MELHHAQNQKKPKNKNTSYWLLCSIPYREMKPTGSWGFFLSPDAKVVTVHLVTQSALLGEDVSPSSPCPPHHMASSDS
jgi:hypothetical protein